MKPEKKQKHKKRQKTTAQTTGQKTTTQKTRSRMNYFGKKRNQIRFKVTILLSRVTAFKREGEFFKIV